MFFFILTNPKRQIARVNVILLLVNFDGMVINWVNLMGDTCCCNRYILLFNFLFADFGGSLIGLRFMVWLIHICKMKIVYFIRQIIHKMISLPKRMSIYTNSLSQATLTVDNRSTFRFSNTDKNLGLNSQFFQRFLLYQMFS